MHHKRRIKLIKPPLQLKMTLLFVSVSALSLLLQAVLLMSGLTRAALDLPNDHLMMLDRVNSVIFESLLSSFVLFLPLTFAVGILTTFRFAGPIYRFEMFLRQVIRGEKPADCRLRQGDELKDFCELINEATAPLREAAPEAEEGIDADSVPSLVDAATNSDSPSSEESAREVESNAKS